MTRHIQSHSTTQVIETTTQLDLVELEAGLFLFQRQVSSKRTGRGTTSGLRPNANDAPAGRQVGFVNDAGRKQLLAGKAVAKANQKKLTWLTPEDIEAFRTLGYPAAQDALWAKWGNQEPDVWADWASHPERAVDEAVRIDHAEHLLYDRNDRPLPVALLFDYISGHVDNVNYDLGEVYEHLRGRADVRLLRGEDRMRKCVSEQAEPTCVEEALFHIPYYNVHEGRDMALQFLWVPQAEVYAQAFSGWKGQRHTCVLHKDLLGLRALRKNEDPYA